MNAVRTFVIDTNVALDLFVFFDPATHELKSMLDAGQIKWIATQEMRDEFERVLGYQRIQKRMGINKLTPEEMLAAYDSRVTLVDVAAKAPFSCSDEDDQRFIDLAVAHVVPILSKDVDVLAMKRRLATLDVVVSKSIRQALEHEAPEQEVPTLRST